MSIIETLVRYRDGLLTRPQAFDALMAAGGLTELGANDLLDDPAASLAGYRQVAAESAETAEKIARSLTAGDPLLPEAKATSAGLADVAMRMTRAWKL